MSSAEKRSEARAKALEFASLSERLALCNKKKDAYTCIENVLGDDDPEISLRIAKVWEMSRAGSAGNSIREITDTNSPYLNESKVDQYKEIRKEFDMLKWELSQRDGKNQSLRKKKNREHLSKGAVAAIFLFIIIAVIVIIAFIYSWSKGGSEDVVIDRSRSDRSDRSRSDRSRGVEVQTESGEGNLISKIIYSIILVLAIVGIVAIVLGC
jgi:hypothetical protein